MEAGSARAGAPSRGSRLIRLIAVLAFVAVAAIVVLMLLGGDTGHRYKLMFENGGQLVTGNEVLVAGQPVGIIDGIELSEDAQAEVSITTDEPLHEGTSAVIRATSLSGIANRYIALTMGPNNAPELKDGAVLAGDDTTAPVDVDQLFDTFDAKTRKGLQNFIGGFGTVYTGNLEEANRTYKFLNPGIVSTRNLLAELNRDQQALSDFLASSSSVFSAVAERRDELSSLIANSNAALGAIAQENESLDRDLELLPPTLRQANTTFLNLRFTLDDLEPLVETAKPATKDLAPFLRRLRPVAQDAVPVFNSLQNVFNRAGANNDLTDTLNSLPETERLASKLTPRLIAALDESQPTVEQTRPYTPELTATIAHLGQTTAYYDGNGHFARVMPAGLNIFDYNGGNLEPIADDNQLDGYAAFDVNDFGPFERCPGAATQPASDGSTPFLDDGNLAGQCESTQFPPGP